MKSIDLALLRNCTEANLHITLRGRKFRVRIYTRMNGERAINASTSDPYRIQEIKDLFKI